MGVGHLSRIMLLVGVGLNILGELDETSSCWELIVLWEEVKLLVGLSGGGVVGPSGIQGRDMGYRLEVDVA